VYLAKPSQKYSDTVIVGGVDQYFVRVEMLKRVASLAGLLLFSFLIIGLCAWLAGFFLVRPIRELRSALDKVSQGNLELEITSDRLDELGMLAGNFTSMVRGMKERKQLAELLSDQAIEAISGDKLTPGKVLPARSFAGVALVCDIRNFTTLCEEKSVIEITELLDQHFAEMARIITSNGGRIYKFIGDAVEAVFQETEAGDSSMRAVKSAVEMHRAKLDLNEKRKEQGLFTYGSGVGLAYGTFYSGQIGSEETRIDYAVIGDPLARAAEMEAASKFCEKFPIVVDEKIRHLLGENIDFAQVEEASSAFTLEAGSALVKEILANYRKELKGSAYEILKKEPLDNNSEKVVRAGKITRGMRWSAVLLFSLLAGLVGLGVILGFYHRNSVERNSKIRDAQEGIFRLAEQLKSEAAPKIAFEMRMKRLVKKIEARLSFLPIANEKRIIEKYIADELNKLAEEGFASSRAAAFYFMPEGKQSATLEDLLEPLINHRMTDQQAIFMKNLAAFKFKSFYDLKRDVFKQKISGNIEKEIGTNLSLSILVNENFGAAFSVVNNNRPEYFYWNFITVYDPDIYKTRLDEDTKLLKKCPEKGFRIVGLMMVAIPESSVRASPDFLVSGYDEQNFGFALIGPDNKMKGSKGFPAFSHSQKPGFKSPLPVLADFYFNEQAVRIGQETYRLLTSLKLRGETFEMGRISWLVLAIVLLAVVFFYVSIFHSTILSRSVGVQLWFSILLIAIVPIITVIFVIDLSLGEHQQAMVVQEKMELQRFID
jgi:class 3 adenylate cyclase